MSFFNDISKAFGFSFQVTVFACRLTESLLLFHLPDPFRSDYARLHAHRDGGSAAGGLLRIKAGHRPESSTGGKQVA
jgi:hypothetical protein